MCLQLSQQLKFLKQSKSLELLMIKGNNYVYFFENNKHEYLYFILLNISIILLITKLKYIYLNHIYLFGSSLVYISLFALSSSAIYDYHFSYNQVFIPVFIILLLSFKNNIRIFDKVFLFFSTLSSIRIIYWVMK